MQQVGIVEDSLPWLLSCKILDLIQAILISKDMMRLISNGEPYVYTHRCTGSENRGDIMTMEGVHRFLVETLYESFLHCGSKIKKVEDS